MTLLINESEVENLADMPMAMEAIEDVFRMQNSGAAINSPRRRVSGGTTTLQLMGGAVPGLDRIGFKAYVGGVGGARFIVNLYRESTGELDAIIEAGHLGQLRTGAASGVSAKLMARPDAGVATIIGSGYQARTQLEAVARVRKLTAARVHSRDAARREAFAAEMSSRLDLSVVACATGREACVGADLIVTATSSAEPVLAGDWIEPGAHVMATGANRIQARELDAAALASFDLVAADDIGQAKIESGDLTAAVAAGDFAWEDIVPLADIAAGAVEGRGDPRQRTLYKSLGITIWDIALADRVYRAARAAGAGAEIAMYQTVQG
ncbi:MAG: ornithine cyclodeaminase family protein [Chloroflexota bacterium]|jgi:ornithine cyclodeaminase/alanine dehydrogenase-like protein (mu-crystallin family)|nr:ornithine cyclodeaminase family protein [Chloroflexota bacterium]